MKIRKIIYLVLLTSMIFSACNSSTPNEQTPTSTTSENQEEQLDVIWTSYLLSYPLPSIKHQAIEAFYDSPTSEIQSLSIISQTSDNNILLGTIDKNSNSTTPANYYSWEYDVKSGNLTEIERDTSFDYNSLDDRKEYVMSSIIKPFIDDGTIVLESIKQFADVEFDSTYQLGYLAAYEDYYVLLSFDDSKGENDPYDVYILYLNYGGDLIEYEKFKYDEDYHFVEYKVIKE